MQVAVGRQKQTYIYRRNKKAVAIANAKAIAI